MDSSSNTVVVTGFGPFRQYLVNSSWEAVKELSKRGLGKNINLRIMQLPVVYQKAKEKVFMIWTTLQPWVSFLISCYSLWWEKNQLTVHVGLASSAKAIIILEQCGKNKGYQEMDACGFHPEGGCCMLDGPEKIESTINMKTLWKNISVEGIDIIFSRDAGRYICDYTYYASLYYGNGRAAFIHVPPLSKSVTADFLGKALQTIILEMLKQCREERE
ncbi:pyroglutamyl-peptidase 1-like protein isoform X1 [Cuculus canorus]|uniref:pyroglutamyl-peptidase 1-like protein isoform X1 n=2 Tax=Cuculus canorus TaxID=55661 RepID=UPI0023AB3E90|nr:pyroglutamyl-peptidase 1-like protein isoform X1 [Cuculus canorus]XP_053934009.1 pyroglutamyl-peptidase 1-like protein isoform X1 [Cuculus canorus]XP_053934010.1 pyroglutamyl-peptidase 1-like protein isoform X1 [Cuculus canorus]XP_053934011.1 pyroglutamyl-peptidase 1-like protein isoform X1 [Cuculus canorus]XP_053934012.1 pyroglutamyl-peptidase 1-like protein isoform X1 [Cuculus canorus]